MKKRRALYHESSMNDVETVKKAVAESALNLLESKLKPMHIEFPALILVTGVNGVGKTTTIAKLANLFRAAR